MSDLLPVLFRFQLYHHSFKQMKSVQIFFI